MDEMAEALGLDPVQFRLMPPITSAIRRRRADPALSLLISPSPAVEVLQEGAKAFGWDKRDATPGRCAGPDSSGASEWE